MNPYIQYMYSYPHKTAYRPLEGIRLEDYLPALAGGGHSLYIHIPFCQSKCGYCNLFSVTGQDQRFVDRYLDTVERQSQQYGRLLAPYRTEFSSLTIGGGTPLLLSEEQMQRMFSIVQRCFAFSAGRELVIETAPNQTTPEKLRLLKEAGATRISMGIQSFSDEELKVLQRSHRADRAREALALLKTYAFPCINVDFIYGIPGQTVQSLLCSLKEVLAFEPDEIFLYPLYVKHGARLEANLREGMVLEPETAFAQYQEAAAFLEGQGFRQDSMRRFLRLGRQRDEQQDGRQNRRQGGQQDLRRAYSECGAGTSLALGCGGRSYLGNLHFCSPYAITRTDCLAQLHAYGETRDFSRITHGLLLSREEQKRRYVIRHLLIQPGLSLSRYQKHFHGEAMEDFPLLKRWREKGYVEIQEPDDVPEDSGWKAESYLTLTQAGMGLSDYLGPQLMSPEIIRLMEEWEAVHGQSDDPVPGHSEKL